MFQEFRGLRLTYGVACRSSSDEGESHVLPDFDANGSGEDFTESIKDLHRMTNGGSTALVPTGRENDDRCFPIFYQ